MKSVPLVQEDVEFGFFSFQCEKVSQGPVARVAVVAVFTGGVVKVGVEVEDDGLRRLSSFRFFQQGWSCGRVRWGSSRWLTCPC